MTSRQVLMTHYGYIPNLYEARDMLISTNDYVEIAVMQLDYELLLDELAARLREK